LYEVKKVIYIYNQTCQLFTTNSKNSITMPICIQFTSLAFIATVMYFVLNGYCKHYSIYIHIVITAKLMWPLAYIYVALQNITH